MAELQALQPFGEKFSHWDVPEDLIYVTEEALEIGEIKSTWTHITAWGTCGLEARLEKGKVQYRKYHLGLYACCREASVRMAGHVLRGGINSAPIWARLLWNERKVTKTRDGSRYEYSFFSFWRTSLDTLEVRTRDSHGWPLSIVLRRNPEPDELLGCTLNSR